MPSLTLANSLRAIYGSFGFSPASLFSGGAPGVWYDPSDYSTLFQDSAGTTPVTAVEQPVGLMLDKSQGLVLGPQLVPDSSFDSAASWTAQSGDWVVAGGKATYTESATAVVYLESNANISLDAGKWYEISCTLSGIASGSAVFGLFNKTASVNLLGGYVTVATNGTYVQRIFVASSVTGIRIYGNNSGTATSWSLDSFSIKALPGNHAFQSTSASRPVLSARYNLLTKTEQFNDAAWTKASVTAANTNETTDPLGGNTADKVTCTSTVNTAHIRQDVSNVSGYSYSFYAKAGTSNFACFTTNTNATYANFNLSTGAVSSSAGCTAAITLIGNGWYRCVITNAQSGIYFMILGKDADPAAQPYGNGNWTSGNYIYTWGADLRVANNGITQPAYQRVNTSTDYATTGFLPYLKFDGVDDGMSTNSINFTSTDKMSVFSGVRKLSDAGIGVLVELSARAFASNPGSFGVYLPLDATNEVGSYSVGTLLSSLSINNDSYISPVTLIATALYSISSDENTVRANANQIGTIASNQGTGNYGNYPLYIGRRGGASLSFNGQLYSMIIVGKQVTATELSSTETYTAIKTGVTLA